MQLIIAAAILVGGSLVVASRVGATNDPNATFSFLADPYTQELWAVANTYPVGVAFAGNGDVLTCLGGGHRFSAANTTVVHGSTIHTQTTFSSGCNGLGLTNNPDGFVYHNAYDGVRRLDPNNNLALIAGPFGPPGSAYGIATDPQTGNLVYVASDYSIQWVNPTFTTGGTFSTNSKGHGLIDQIAFDPTGNYLFLSGLGDHTLIILHRDGSVVQVVPLSHQPDGIAFHASAPQYVATNNTDGTLSRFDFPNNDFTQAPTQSVLGSGAGRGDHTGVGPDGCWYVSNASVKYADGTPGHYGLVRICPGFARPPGVVLGTTLKADPALVDVLPGATILYPNLTAHLSDTNGNPVVARTIVFSTQSGGAVICTADTDATGTAACAGSLTATLSVTLGYEASFAGDSSYKASSAHGPLIRVNGIGIL